MSDYVKCANCGKQTLMDGNDPGEPCQFCGKPAGIKEVAVITGAKKEDTHPSLKKSGERKAEAMKSENKDIQEESAPLYLGTSRKYQRGTRKWGKRCKACKFGYSHDDLFWCSSKRCPQRCPPKLRPQYRPKVEQEATPKIQPEPNVERLPQRQKDMDKAKLEVKVAYLSGWKDCSEKFLAVLEK